MSRFEGIKFPLIRLNNFFGPGPVGDLKKDVFYSIILSIPSFSGLFLVGMALVSINNIDAINNTVTTILGLLFPVLAIVYTFGFRDENPAIKELKRIGKFDDVVSVFTISISGIGLVWIYTFTITVFELETIGGRFLQFTFAYLAVVAFFFVILRLWRCFQIFILLNKAIQSNE